MALYLDSSALVKLVLEVRESDDLRLFVEDREIASIEIARTELIRAVGRRAPGPTGDAEDLLAEVVLMRVDTPTTSSAAWVQPWEVRALDALHLAGAGQLGADLEALVTYDKRMIDAGRAAGLLVAMPGDEVA